MCTNIAVSTDLAGSGMRPHGWYRLVRAVLSSAHPFHPPPAGRGVGAALWGIGVGAGAGLFRLCVFGLWASRRRGWVAERQDRS